MPTEYSWPLESPPAPTPTSSTTTGSTVGAEFVFSRKRGVLTPFRRDAKNDFANGGGKALLRSHLEQILGVRAGNEVMAGEYAWRSDFGSLIELIRHRNNNETTRELARTFVVQAVSRWTSAIRVTDVDIVEMKGEPERLVLRVWYETTERGVRESDSVDLDLPGLAA